MAASVTTVDRAAVPQLAQLLGAYFHQDWVVDATTWQEVVDDYVLEVPGGAEACAAEIARVLDRGLAEDELARVMRRLGCSVDPAAYGQTPAQWLEAVKARLEAAGPE